MFGGALTGIFWRLAAASLFGGGLTLVLLLLRPWLRRMGSGFAYYCWLAPLLILLAAPWLPAGISVGPLVQNDAVNDAVNGGNFNQNEGFLTGEVPDINFNPANQQIWLEGAILPVQNLNGAMAGISDDEIIEESLEKNYAENLNKKDAGNPPENANAWLAGLKLQRLAPGLAGIWLAGFWLVLLWWGISYAALRRRVYRDSREVGNRQETVYLPEILDEISNEAKGPGSLAGLELRQEQAGAGLGAPFLLGLLRPCLVLPGPEAGLSGEDWRNMLRHELVHYRRRDLWYKWLGLWACAVHWFNPAVWGLWRALGEDCEISCDWAVCHGLREEERRGYMRTILQLVGPRAYGLTSGLTSGMSDSKGVLRRRFEMIDNIRRMDRKSRWLLGALVGAALLVVAVCGSVSAANLANVANMAGEGQERVSVRRLEQEAALAHEPFVAEGVAYLPLREVLEQFGVLRPEGPGLSYEDGRFRLDLAQPVDRGADEPEMRSFYIREFTAAEVGGLVREGVLYVPTEFVLELGLYAQANSEKGDGLGFFSVMVTGADGRVKALYSQPEFMRDSRQPGSAKKFLEGWWLGAFNSELCNVSNEELAQITAGLPWRVEALAIIDNDKNNGKKHLYEVLTLSKPEDGRSNFDLRRWELEVRDNKVCGIRELMAGDEMAPEQIIGGADGSAVMLVKGHAGRLANPLAKGELTRSFGEEHQGVDWAAASGEPVMAAALGVVSAAGYMGADGNKVLLNHGGGLETRYAHLSEILVKPGEIVTAGQVIGYVGSTGNSTGPHLHFVVLRNGTAIDPLAALAAGAATGDYSSQSEQYYRDNNLPLFQRAFASLPREQQEAWLERLYQADNIAFFSAALDELPLSESMAAKAYTDGKEGFFSIAADRLSEEQLGAWAERAKAEGKTAFRSIVLGKLADGDAYDKEKADMEAALAEYASVGVSMSGKDYYYRGELVDIFLDRRSDGVFYTLSMNPQGTVNIKILRNDDNEVTGVAYLSEAQVQELLGEAEDA